MTVIRYICALSNKIMAVFYKGVKYVAGFLNKQPVSGYLRGYQVFPDAVTILGAELLLYDLPEGYTGYTKLEYIPACGGKTKQCIVRYKYKDAYNKDIFGDITVDYLEGEIGSESKYYTESGLTYVGTRHVNFNIEGVPYSNYEIIINQEANIVTKTPKSEPSKPLKEDAWYYYTPKIKSFSYTGYGLLAQGGDATPKFVIEVTKVESRYLITEKTWNDYQSTAMEEAGFEPRQVDVQGGIKEWVDISAPVTTEYTDINSGEVIIKFDAANLISAATLKSYNTGVIAVNSMGTTPYPNGRTIGDAKIIVTVPRIKDGQQSRVEQVITISQGANTVTEDWRITPAFVSTEYKWESPVITSISCALVGASGSPAKVIVKYSQSKYKYQYDVTEQKSLYYVWTSGAEEYTGMSTGGEKTLISKTESSTITSGGTLSFGGTQLNNSGATIDSSGWVTGVSLYRTITEERDIFKAWATVTANGLTSAKSYITVRQHYNHEYIEHKTEGTSTTTIEYDYSTPVVTLKYTTGVGEESYYVTARGGTLYPSISATQKSQSRSHTYGKKTWTHIYYDADPEGLRVDEQTEDFYTEWVERETITTDKLSDVKSWTGEQVVNGASVNQSNGEVTIKSLGTTPFTEGNVLLVTAVVVLNGKSGLGQKYITQGSNSKTVKSTIYTGINSAELIDTNGNKITEVLSYEAQTIFIRTQAIKTITYVWTSDAESTETEYEYKRADSYTRSNPSLFEVLTSWSYTLNAVPVLISKNTDKNNRRGGYIVATINGKNKITQSITQEVNTEPESTTADTYLIPVSYQSSVTSNGQQVLVWDLKRTNKPMYASTVVKYSFTKAGPSVTPTTITGSVYVSASEAEGNVIKANIASGVMVVVVNYKEDI